MADTHNKFPHQNQKGIASKSTCTLVRNNSAEPLNPRQLVEGTLEVRQDANVTGYEPKAQPGHFGVAVLSSVTSTTNPLLMFPRQAAEFSVQKTILANFFCLFVGPHSVTIH